MNHHGDLFRLRSPTYFIRSGQSVAARQGSRIDRVYRCLIAFAVFVFFAFAGAIVLGEVVDPRSESGPTESTPIKKAANDLQVAAGASVWKLEAVGEKPTIHVDGFDGFQILLRRTWREYTNAPQQIEPPGTDLGPFILKHEDWQFVLISTKPKQAPVELRSKIPWAKTSNPYHSRDVCLGEGKGFVWFARGTLFGQESVREKLGLTGGDDRMALLIDGMQVVDTHTMTANSCQRAIAPFGDAALTAIEQSINKTPDPVAVGRIIGSLAFIQTARATELLVRLYGSDQDKIRDAAAYALAYEPYRPAAKSVYLDLLRRHQRVYESCRASVLFDWKEAIPVLNDLLARPANLRELSFAIPARRTLLGNPIPPDLLDAKQKILAAAGDAKQDSSRQCKLLRESSDMEATMMIAIELATHARKGNSQKINEMGIELLRSRPRQATVEYLHGLIGGMPEGNRRQAEQLLQAVRFRPSPAKH